ncbi:MAG: flagellar basal-body rod protein FlgG [Pseudomonadota bacterium]
MKALAIAATGMTAQQLNVEVISNNVANINTTGFKRGRAEFSDLLYQVQKAEGAPTVAGEAGSPTGIRVGLGVKPTAVRNIHIQGALAETGNDLDVAINGRGFFQITGPNGETVYSRSGSFNKNANGQLVNSDGYLVTPNITVPENTTKITINQSGQVFATIDGQQEPQEIGQLTLAIFANPAGLKPMSGNLFQATTASGTAVTGVPGENSIGTITQGYLESSNVDPVKELTELISAQRAYEMNSKIIQAADEMLGTVSKGIR